MYIGGMRLSKGTDRCRSRALRFPWDSKISQEILANWKERREIDKKIQCYSREKIDKVK